MVQKNNPIPAPHYVFSKDTILGECSVHFLRGSWVRLSRVKGKTLQADNNGSTVKYVLPIVS